MRRVAFYELFRFHPALVSELGGCLLGRRLYETMLVWETDLSLRAVRPPPGAQRPAFLQPLLVSGMRHARVLSCLASSGQQMNSLRRMRWELNPG